MKPNRHITGFYAGLFAALCMLYTGCGTGDNNLRLDVASAREIAIKPAENNELDMHSWIDSIRYIPLETDSSYLVGHVSKLQVYQGRFYLMDKHYAKSIFCFEQDGRFAFQIGRQGKGPGEYSNLESFAIDEQNHWVEVYDRGGQKIIYFDTQGVFVKETPFPLYFLEFLPTAEDYWLYTADDNVVGDKQYAYNLLRVSTDGSEILAAHFPYLPVFHDVGFPGRLSKNVGLISFAYGWQNEIYHLSDTAVSLAYKVDFGAAAIPAKWYEDQPYDDEKMEAFMARISDSPYAFGLHYLAETPAHLSFCYLFENLGTAKNVVYCKKTGHWINREQITTAEHIVNAPIESEGDYFYSAIDAAHFLEAANTAEKPLMPAEFNHSLQYGHNPVIIQIKFKDF